MKKILLSVAFLGATFIGAEAQQTFSFEASENFVLGDINGQMGWISTPVQSGGNIAGQTVSNAVASDGDYSLSIAGDSNFGTQQNPIMGAIYNFSNPLAHNVISFDVYIDDVIGTASDYRIGTVDTGAGYFTFIVQFRYNGQIALLVDGAFEILSGTEWTPNTWYNVKFGVDGTNALYFINDQQVNSATATALQLGSFDSFRFVHDNYNVNTNGVAYIDNIKINVESFASTEDFATTSFSIYPNPATDVINISNSLDVIENVKITDLNGRIVKEIASDIEKVQINISDLAQGVYILNATSNGRTITEKIVKK